MTEMKEPRGNGTGPWLQPWGYAIRRGEDDDE